MTFPVATIRESLVNDETAQMAAMGQPITEIIRSRHRIA